MSRMCRELALDIGLGEDLSEQLLHASSMHDIGKIAVPDSVLLKPGPLTPEEWEVMKSHTTIGAQLLSGSRSPVVRMAEVIARTHHEKWDGSGYPQGLHGRDIPIPGRVMAIVDVYDASTTRQLYRTPLSHDDAIAFILKGRGTHFDPDVVDAFLAVSAEFRRLSLDPEISPPD
jgi:putative two-component system response regulator